MTRTALLRAAVPLLAVPWMAGALTVGAAPAAATPADPGDTSVVLAAPADDATGSDRPVQVDVGRFEPRTITPGAVVTVTGTLTNTGTSRITDLGVRLQRGHVLTTRAELAALDGDPDPATAVTLPFQEVPGDLAPGDELEFSYTVDSADLQLERDGVYPVLLNVNGTVEGDQSRVGELPTFVVQQPVAPASRTTVAWLWPLVEASHRTAMGGFADDRLTDAVATGGRLDRALAVLERLPGAAAPDGNGTVPAVPVTLAIDPALVEELEIMAAGPYDVAGDDDAGRGTDEAAAFLDRLRTVAAAHPVVALPYGDVDADAMTEAGLTDVVTRSLPGTPEGTAEDPPGAEPQADAAATSAPATATEGAQPAEEADATGAGARIIAEALDVAPLTDLAWAADGSFLPGTVATFREGGVSRVVLGPGGLTEGDAATGLTGDAAAARTTVATPSGPLDALVADSRLGDVVGSAEQADGGARMAEQRYLAELALLSLQAPAGAPQTVLVAPPRTVDAGPEGAGAMIADTVGLPWLAPGSLNALSTGPAAVGGELVEIPDAPRLDPAGTADVVAAVASRDDLASAVVGDPDVALRTFDAATSRTVSVVRRGDPEGYRDAAADLVDAIERLRGKVTLLAPADGTYSLASGDAPLVLTVRNDLPFAVEVRLDIRTRGNRGLSVDDSGTQRLAPGERTTLRVPTDLRQSGGFAVTAQLTTPAGGPLGDRVEMQVKSTAYGSISLLITFGAAGLLGVLFLRRLVRFLLRRRRAAAGAELPPAGPEGAVGLPPTRSPV